MSEKMKSEAVELTVSYITVSTHTHTQVNVLNTRHPVTPFLAFDYELPLQFLKKLLLLQYLVNVLEGDFWPRNCAYRGKIQVFHCDRVDETML